MIKINRLFWLIITLSLLLFLPTFSSACDGSEGHENMTAAHGHSSLADITDGAGGIREKNSLTHQILEVMLGINSFLLNILMLTGIYWLVKSAKRKE